MKTKIKYIFIYHHYTKVRISEELEKAGWVFSWHAGSHVKEQNLAYLFYSL